MERGKRIHMKGDIIITDPCYVIKDDLWGRFLNDVPTPPGNISTISWWHEFKEGLVADTLYGDWGCTLFKVKDIDSAIEALKNESDYEDSEAVGKFCADAGMVCVFYLNDCLTHNKEEVEELLTKNWCATVIKDFDGDIYILDMDHEYEYKGKKYEDTDRHLIFENNNGDKYISCQTSL